VLRTPQELAPFRWVIDAKELNGTEYERLWRALISPLVQSNSVHEPFTTIEGCDYSHFERFYVDNESLPEHVKPYTHGHGGLNFGLILNEHFTLDEIRIDAGSKARRHSCLGIHACAERYSKARRVAGPGWPDDTATQGHHQADPAQSKRRLFFFERTTLRECDS